MTGEADAPVTRDQRGGPVPGGEDRVGTTEFRPWGKSKDHRDDLSPVVAGMAVTCDGIRLRVWYWPRTPASQRRSGR